MKPFDFWDRPTDQYHLDTLLNQYDLFSRRVTNALLRHGIVTPRIIVMHARESLLLHTSNLGAKGLAEIENELTQQGWSFASQVDEKRIALVRWLSIVFSKNTRRLSLSDLTFLVNDLSHADWDESSIAEGAAYHPYIEVNESGFYKFHLRELGDVPYDPSIDIIATTIPEIEEKTVIDLDFPTIIENSSSEQKTPRSEILYVSEESHKILLSKLWHEWLSPLDYRQQKILLLRYGIAGEEPLNLQEIGEALGLTRERVRQIEAKAFQRLLGSIEYSACQTMRQLLSGSIQQANHLLTPTQWEQWLDENVIWGESEPRPLLLQFLCETFSEYHYLNRYQIATLAEITEEHIKDLQNTLKIILCANGKIGLTILPPNVKTKKWQK